MTEFPLKTPAALGPEVENYCLTFARLAALGMLSSAIMHDLRNYLTILSGNIQILQMKQGQAEPVELLQRLDKMMGQIERAENAIGRVESFSRRAEGVVREIAPELALDNAILAFEHQQGIKESRIARDLSPLSKQVACDASLLEFIIIELLKQSDTAAEDAQLLVSAADSPTFWECRLEHPSTTDPKAAGKSELSMNSAGLWVASLAAERMGGELRRFEGDGRAGWRLRIPWAR